MLIQTMIPIVPPPLTLKSKEIGMFIHAKKLTNIKTFILNGSSILFK